MPARRVKSPTKSHVNWVIAKYKDGDWYPARIAKRHQGGEGANPVVDRVFHGSLRGLLGGEVRGDHRSANETPLSPARSPARSLSHARPVATPPHSLVILPQFCRNALTLIL